MTYSCTLDAPGATLDQGNTRITLHHTVHDIPRQRAVSHRKQVLMVLLWQKKYVPRSGFSP